MVCPECGILLTNDDYDKARDEHTCPNCLARIADYSAR